jgi:hypothetical protein
MALRIATNSPQQVRLLAVEPETAPSSFGGDQLKFRTSAGDLYVSPAVGAIFLKAIAAQAIQAGEWVEIAKSEAALGNGRKGIRWALRRLTAAAPAPAVGIPSVRTATIGVSPVGPQADGSFAIDAPPAAPVVERKAAATATESRPQWASVLLAQTNALADVYAAALAHSSATHGNAVKPEDVRSLLVTCFIGLQKKSEGANHAAA